MCLTLDFAPFHYLSPELHEQAARSITHADHLAIPYACSHFNSYCFRWSAQDLLLARYDCKYRSGADGQKCWRSADCINLVYGKGLILIISAG